MAGPSAELASFVCSTRFEDLPLPVVNRAKQVILDTVGCALGGLAVAREECAWIVDFVRDQGGNPQATVWGSGMRTSCPWAVLANGTIVHTIDFDDTHVGSVSHLGATLVPTILAVGEHLGCTGREALAALVVGFEVGVRVGRSVMPDHYCYWHPTATLGTIAAATAACKLLGLGEEQVDQAIGLAADQAAGFRYCIDKGDFSKSLHPGFAAMKGVASALLVAGGATGPRGLLEYPTGFCAAMSANPVLANLTEGLATRYEIMEDSFKLFPTIYCSHAAIEAVLSVRRRENLSAQDVTAVRVRMTELAKGQGLNYDPETPLAARLSIPFCLATAVVKGRVGLDDFGEADLRDPEVRAVMGRVHVTSDPELNRKYPDALAAVVTMETAHGIFEEEVVYPRGHAKNPAGDEELAAKFRDLASLLWPDASRVEAILQALGRFESLDSVAELSRLLAD